MPVGWIGFSTETAPFIQAHPDPEELRDQVVALIGNVPGVSLIGDVYFDNYRERAYILVEGLDDWVDAKALTRALGADEYTKLIRADLSKSARGRQNQITPKPKRPKKPTRPRKPRT
jgi:hypothetical protein